MHKIFIPRGVCSRKYEIDIEDGVVKDIVITGGCHGNLQGIAALLRGQRAEDIVKRLSGIRCGMKSTSCPDQIAKALAEAIEEEKGAAV